MGGNRRAASGAFGARAALQRVEVMAGQLGGQVANLLAAGVNGHRGSIEAVVGFGDQGRGELRGQPLDLFGVGRPGGDGNMSQRHRRHSLIVRSAVPAGRRTGQVRDRECWEWRETTRLSPRVGPVRELLTRCANSMPARLLYLVTLLLVPVSVAAQDTRDEGLRALLLGDYGRAAQILRPLAEDRRAPDHVAQFMTAILFDTGRGVRHNSFHACTLFMAAAANPGPFATQAEQLSRSLRESPGVRQATCGFGGPPEAVEPTPPFFMLPIPHGAPSFALD